jgi:hypothetical protein
MIHNTEHNSSGVIVEQNDRKQSLPAALQPLKTNIPLGVNRQPTSSVGNPQVLLATHKFCWQPTSSVTPARAVSRFSSVVRRSVRRSVFHLQLSDDYTMTTTQALWIQRVSWQRCQPAVRTGETSVQNRFHPIHSRQNPNRSFPIDIAVRSSPSPIWRDATS